VDPGLVRADLCCDPASHLLASCAVVWTQQGGCCLWQPAAMPDAALCSCRRPVVVRRVRLRRSSPRPSWWPPGRC